jgi:MFS family permease
MLTGSATATVRRVIANPRLRRVEIAFLAFACAEYGVWVAMLVYAYQQGGTTASAVVAVAQLLPAAVVAPIAGGLADRRGAAHALWMGYVLQAVVVGATATLLLLAALSAAAYAGAIVAASAVTLTRPAQGALLPSLVDDRASSRPPMRSRAGWRAPAS